MFFEKQTPESLDAAIERFESMKLDAKSIRKHAEKFDKKVFQEKLI